MQRSEGYDNPTVSAMYSYYVRYNELTQLINREFYNSNATNVNLFVDVHGMLVDLKKNKVTINQYAFIAGLINLAAHYRQFFKTRYSCTTKIWFINALDNVIPRFYYKNFDHNTDVDMIDNNIMKQLCNYIPDVMYVTCRVDCATMAIKITEDEKLIDPCILITKDWFEFQICSYGNFYVLRPKKFKGQDNSYLVNRQTAVGYLPVALCNNSEVLTGIDAFALPVLLSLWGVPSRKISYKYRMPKPVTLLLNYMKKYKYGYPWDTEAFFTRLSEVNGDSIHKDIFELVNRFKAIDVVYFQSVAYKSLPDYKTDYTGMVNLYDPRGMQEINEKYFKSYPLDLEVL